MAMVVKTNIDAQKGLNTLNKNSKALAKSLKKVSSGMKINSASDDASGYAISEGMRVQLRALTQANSNTQNANSLLKVADGAMSNTVDILRTMREKAINAANDTNTDSDRAIIQKELDQSIDQITDNGNVTFNGKRIFDGALNHCENNEQRICAALNTEWLANSLDLIERSTGMSFKTTPGIKEMAVYFEDDPSSSALAYVGSGYANNRTDLLFMVVNMHYYNDMAEDDVNGASSAGYLDRTIAHEMTHAVMSSNIEGFEGLYACLAEGAAEVIHGIDDERRGTIRSLGLGFDAQLTTSTATSGANTYAAGYVAFRYMAAQCGFTGTESVSHFMNSLKEGSGAMTADRINAAIAAGSKGKFTSFDGLKAAMAADEARSADGDDFLKRFCGIDLDNLDTGAISGHDAGGSRDQMTAESIVPEGGSTKFWANPTQKTTNIEGLSVKWQEGELTFTSGGVTKTVHSADIQIKGGMRFHTGTESSQNLHVAFAYADAKAMGLQDNDNKNIQVTTMDKAKAAMQLIDNSLNHALNQLTTIGAIQSRLEYTAMNLTTAHENTTSAESTIRDADMAKEMTEYTKNNVLMQSAQSMLSQANQNSSAALSLLQ